MITAVGAREGATSALGEAAASPRRARRWRLGRIVAGVLGTIWLVIVVVPIYFMVITSLRSQNGYLLVNPWDPVKALTLQQYSTVFHAGLGTYVINSVIVTVVTIAITAFFSLTCAFRIVRSGTRLPGVVFRYVLAGLAIPVQSIIVPLYLLVDKLHLYDTREGLILALSASAIPVSVLVMVNFVRTIPRELIDAITVDGGGEGVVFRHLIWPLSRGVVATICIYEGLNTWNNFLLPLVLTQSPATAVLPLGLFKFQTQYGVDLPATMAAVIVSVLPLVVLYLLLRRQLIKSLSGITLR